jgi:uncharacterized protein YbjT (DUF2867 family)
VKVAITGATGFTGRRVVRELLRRGHEVVALVRAPASRKTLPTEAAVVEGDMGDPAPLGCALSAADAFVHVASLGFGQAGTVVEAVEASRVRRAVFFSSTAIFTRLPAASKEVRTAAEARIRGMRRDWTILRPTMIYGDAGDRNMARLIRFLARSPVVPLPGGGRGLVQPVHVDDLGLAAVDALRCDAAVRREYNLPGAYSGSLREIVDHVAGLLGRKLWVVPLPLRPLAAATGFWGRLGLAPRLSAEQVLRLDEDKAFDFTDARRDWGYEPRGWREGLAAEVDTLRRQGQVR